MSNARHLPNDKQGTSGLKLKIKFSKSKGFVSDFVEATSQEKCSLGNEHVVSVPCDPAFVGEQNSTPGLQQLPLNESHHKHQKLCRLSFVQNSPLLQANGSATDSEPVDLTFGQAAVNDSSNQDSICDPRVAKVRSHSPVLGSELPRASLDTVHEEPPSDQQEIPGYPRDRKRHSCDDPDPGQEELPGVNYGQVLQDLQFLSSQQDEPACGGDYPRHRKFKQHWIVTRAAAQVDESTMAGREVQPNSGIGRETEEGRDGLSEIVQIEFSDEEPMSPFDINCSLGFADDDFPFATSSHKQGNDQDCVRSHPRENPLFPWSVVSSPEPCPLAAEHSRASKPMSAGLNQVRIAGGFSMLTSEQPVQPGMTVATGKSTSSHEGNAGIAGDTHGDGTLKRVIVIDCRNHRGTGLDTEINNNRNFSQFNDGNSLLDRSSHPDPGNSHCTYQNGEFMNVGTLSDAAAYDLGHSTQSLTALPRRQQDQQKQDKSTPKDLLRMLLARKEKAPNALRANRTSPPVATGIDQSADGTPSADATPSQLNRTIVELRKRVGEEVPFKQNPSATSQNGDSLSQAGSSTQSVNNIVDSETTQGSGKTKQHPMWQVWCRCEEPEPDDVLEEYEDLAGNVVSLPEICKKCWKKLSKRWKKLKCKQEKSVGRNPDNLWCRCQPPEPHIPEGSVVSVKEICKKCWKRVGKKWKRRMAAKWCKCGTLELYSAGPSGEEEGNGSDKHNACKRCGMWVSKEREELGIRGDSSRERQCYPPMGPQHVMADHIYSQSPFLPHTGHKVLLFATNAPMGSGNGLVAHTAQRQSAQGHALQAQTAMPVQENISSSKRVIYVFPSNSRIGNNMDQPLEHENVVLRGSDEENRGISEVNTFAKLPSRISPEVTGTASLIPAPQTDLQIDCVTEPPSGNVFVTNSHAGLCAISSEERISAVTALNSSAGEEGGTGPDPTIKVMRKIYRQAKRPPFPHGVNQDILHPCFVVVEKMPDGLHTRQAAENPPCSESCRKQSLDFLCGTGKLQQCKRSFKHQMTLEELNEKCFSVWNKKRDFFRRNKILDGYEEYRQKALEQKQRKHSEQSVASGGAEVSTVPPWSGFLPLSSLCTKGATNMVISPDGISVEQLAQKQQKQKIISRLLSRAECKMPRETTGKAKQVGEKKANTTGKKQPEVLDSTVINSDEYKQAFPDKPSSDSWMKVSKFNVKYYVFQCGNRAFVVPLIKSSRGSGAVKRLDEEDLGYVTAVISKLLVETDSCARHLKYPDSLQHKKLRRTATQRANVVETSSKKAFVAPTVGAEGLDIQSLKSLISDKDFSRLVPQDSRISKSKYLQQIGEKVHMYLTGGSEEAPDWIKGVAKSIVMKHRRRMRNKKRLKPSKDVTIEIDYAEEWEEELVDVGEETSTPPLYSAVEVSEPSGCNVAPTVEDSYAAVYEGVDPTNLYHQDFAFQADYTCQQTGSYVCEEAYAQEEKKPLVGQLMDVAQPADPLAGDGNASVLAQHIMVPLPQGCDYGQEDQAALSAPTTFPQQPISETSVGEDPPERKPLLGELLAATILPAAYTADEHAYNDDRQNHSSPPQQHKEQQLGDLFKPTGGQHQQDQQQPTRPLALVKEEPPEEDYSHAWLSGAQEEAGGSDHGHAAEEERSAFPFISNATFGRGVVQLEDEAGCATAGLSQHVDSVPSATVQPVVKTEPADTPDNAVGIPLITCIAPGEAAALLGDSDDRSVSNEEGSSASTFVDGVESHPHFSPRIVSVTSGEEVSHSAENHVDGAKTDTSEEVSACARELASDSLSHVDFGQDKTRQGKYGDCPSLNDAVMVGGTVNTLVESSSISERFDQDSEKGAKTDQKEEDYGTEDCSLPRISAVAFGEAAMLWEKEGSLADCTAVDQAPRPPATVSECQPDAEPSVPVISSVSFGDAVAHLERETDQQLGAHVGLSDWHQAYQDDDEDYAEDADGGDFYEEEEYVEPDIKPVVSGIDGGQLIFVPVLFPSENPPVSETTAEPAVVLPQVRSGVDFSIVKQEPQEVEEPSSYSLNLPVIANYSHYEAAATVSYNQSSETVGQGEHAAHDDVSAAPVILDVRSLAPLVPQATKDTGAEKPQAASDLPGDSPELPIAAPAEPTTANIIPRSRSGRALGSQRRQKKKLVGVPLASSDLAHEPGEAQNFCLRESIVLSSDTPLFPHDASTPPLLHPDGRILSASRDFASASLGTTYVPSAKVPELQSNKPKQSDTTVLEDTITSCLSSTAALHSGKEQQKTKLPQENQAEYVQDTAAAVCHASSPKICDSNNIKERYFDTKASSSKTEESSRDTNAESGVLDAEVLQGINISKPNPKKGCKRRVRSKPRKNAATPGSSWPSVALRVPTTAERVDSSQDTPVKMGSTTSSTVPLTPAASGGRDNSDITPRVTRLASRLPAKLQQVKTAPGKPGNDTPVTPNADSCFTLRMSSVAPSAASGVRKCSAYAVTAAKLPVEKGSPAVSPTITSRSRRSAVALNSTEVGQCSVASKSDDALTSCPTDASTSLQQLINADDTAAFKQRDMPTEPQDTEISGETSLSGQSLQSAPLKSTQKRRGRARLTLRKKRPAALRSPSSASQTTTPKLDWVLAGASARSETDRTESVDGNSSSFVKEDNNSPTPTKRLKADTVSIDIRSKEDSATTTLQANHHSLKRKLDTHDNAETENNGSGKASVPRAERSMFSHMSAVLSKITSTPSSSSPAMPGFSKISTHSVKVARASSDADGLFSRLQASADSAKGDVAAAEDTGFGTQAPRAQDTGQSAPPKGARTERSFFDCLPQDFVEAWK